MPWCKYFSVISFRLLKQIKYLAVKLKKLVLNMSTFLFYYNFFNNIILLTNLDNSTALISWMAGR